MPQALNKLVYFWAWHLEISSQLCSVCMRSVTSIHSDRRNHRAFLYCYFLSILFLFLVCAPHVARGSDSGCQLLSPWRQQWGPTSCPHQLSPHTWVNHRWQYSLEIGCYSCFWGLLLSFNRVTVISIVISSIGKMAVLTVMQQFLLEESQCFSGFSAYQGDRFIWTIELIWPMYAVAAVMN